jgi:hypothetical protein
MPLPSFIAIFSGFKTLDVTHTGTSKDEKLYNNKTKKKEEEEKHVNIFLFFFLLAN